MFNDGFNNLWPTPVLKDSIKDQDLLSKVINELYSTYDLVIPPAEINQDDIFDLKTEIMERFKKEIVLPAIGQYVKEVFKVNIEDYPHSTLRGWIVGYTQGYHMVNHNHSGSHITGVFYLLTEESNGGQITFEDPRTNANRGYLQEMLWTFKSKSYQPKSGEFLIFPSFLYHHVSPFHGKFRLAVPIDFNLCPYD